ncbi:MAG: hypothetical protein IJO61_03150 [Oscillospiraceae bacterium]|nr:hypothetical protein [Oscillospiraceae bacterium]
MAFYGRNGEGYPDPTASAAIGKIRTEEKRKERHERRKKQRKKNRMLRKQAERMMTNDK